MKQNKELTTNEQYSLSKIILIWLLATLPMSFLGWVVGPILTPFLNLPDTIDFGVARIIVLTIGLMWLFVLSMIIIYLEEGNLSFATIKERLWLTTPQDPKTEVKSNRLFLWLIPFIILVLLLQMGTSFIETFLVDVLKVDPKYLPATLFESQFVSFFKGAWWFLVLIIIFAIFNTVLGEEFLFRGILLPKMEGRFGRWDWVANGFIMGAYHFHQPWGIPSAIIINIFCFSYPARRYKSIWFSIVLHSMQSILLIFLIFGAVIGLA